eukprot:14041062-Alexandrium_andersonii.AAC.1
MTSLQILQRQLTVPLVALMGPSVCRFFATCACRAASRTSALPSCDATSDTLPRAEPAARDG